MLVPVIYSVVLALIAGAAIYYFYRVDSQKKKSSEKLDDSTPAADILAEEEDENPFPPPTLRSEISGTTHVGLNHRGLRLYNAGGGPCRIFTLTAAQDGFSTNVDANLTALVKANDGSDFPNNQITVGRVGDEVRFILSDLSVRWFYSGGAEPFFVLRRFSPVIRALDSAGNLLPEPTSFNQTGSNNDIIEAFYPDIILDVNGTSLNILRSLLNAFLPVVNTLDEPKGSLIAGDWVIEDTPVNVNTNPEGNVVSVKLINIFITDGTDPVTPDSVDITDNDVTIAVPVILPVSDPDVDNFVDLMDVTSVGFTDYLTAAGITFEEWYDTLLTGIRLLKTKGVYEKIHALYLFAGQDAGRQKWNFINQADTDAAFRLTFGGSPTHSSMGLIGNGSTAFANTHLNLGSVLEQNNNGIYLFNNNNVSALDIVIGARGGGGNGISITPRNTANNFACRNFHSTAVTSPNDVGGSTASIGFYGHTRDNSSNYRIRVHDISTTLTEASQTPPNIPIYLLGSNDNGTLAVASTRSLASVAFTEALSLDEETCLKTFMSMTANGHNRYMV